MIRGFGTILNMDVNSYLLFDDESAIFYRNIICLMTLVSMGLNGVFGMLIPITNNE